jgi:hypothetical protein
MKEPADDLVISGFFITNQLKVFRNRKYKNLGLVYGNAGGFQKREAF